MPLPGAGPGRGTGRGTAAVLGGGGGCSVTHLGVGCVSPGWGRHLPMSSRYHSGRRGGGGEPGTAEPSPERDANRLSWEKVNKGHAPCRRPAGAHPRLWPPRVHFHSLSASPPPDSRAALEGGAAADPASTPRAGAAHPLYSPGKGVPHPSKKTVFNLCSLGTRELSMLPPRAAPACTQPREGATGRRRWPPEGVWDLAGCT